MVQQTRFQCDNSKLNLEFAGYKLAKTYSGTEASVQLQHKYELSYFSQLSGRDSLEVRDNLSHSFFQIKVKVDDRWLLIFFDFRCTLSLVQLDFESCRLSVMCQDTETMQKMDFCNLPSVKLICQRELVYMLCNDTTTKFQLVVLEPNSLMFTYMSTTNLSLSEMGLDGSFKIKFLDVILLESNESSLEFRCLVQLEPTLAEQKKIVRDVHFNYDIKSTKLIMIDHSKVVCGYTDSSIVYSSFVSQSSVALMTTKPFNADKQAELEVFKPPAQKTPHNLYKWYQTDEDVTVTFLLEKVFKSKDVKVEITNTCLTMQLKSEEIIYDKVKFYAPVVGSESYWTLEGNSRLSLHLEKKDTKFKWVHLLQTDDGTSESLDPSDLSTITENLNKYTEGMDNLARFEMQQAANSELDKDIDLVDDDYQLTLIDRTVGTCIQKTQHQSFLSCEGSPTALPPPIVLRNDVDALVYTYHPQTSQFEHRATLDAMGFVRASKKDLKTMYLSQNFDLCLLIDLHQHIYIYTQLGTQLVLTLPDPHLILAVELLENEASLIVMTLENVYLYKLK